MKRIPWAVFLLASISLLGNAVAQSSSSSTSRSQQDSPTTPTEIDAKTSTWIQVAPENAWASVSMPGQPRAVINRFNVVEGQPDIVLHQHIVSTNNGQLVFVFNYNDLHADMTDPRKKQKALDGAVRGAVVPLNGSIISKKPKRLRFHKGSEFVFLFNQNMARDGTVSRQILKSHSVVYIIKQRMYELTVIQTQKDYDETIARKFLDSFQYEKQRPNKPTTQQSDNGGGEKESDKEQESDNSGDNSGEKKSAQNGGQ